MNSQMQIAQIRGYQCYVMSVGEMDLLLIEDSRLSKKSSKIRNAVAMAIMRYCRTEALFDEGEAAGCMALIMPRKVIRKLSPEFILGAAYAKLSAKGK